MDFKKTSRISNLLAREYSEDFFKMLVIYKSISASEAASRLNLHIKTTQDFLEELEALGIVSKKEVLGKRRPHFRYTMKKKKLSLEIDFSQLVDVKKTEKKINLNIREKKNSGTIFIPWGKSRRISSVAVFIGEGRNRKERKINLTEAQGRFLYYLPFPTERAGNIMSISKKAGIDESLLPEVIDVIEILKKYDVIEVDENSSIYTEKSKI